MTHKQKDHTYEKAYQFLDGLSVYEIRSICRALNIPAGLNKKQRLISDIVKAVSERGIPESAAYSRRMTVRDICGTRATQML